MSKICSFDSYDELQQYIQSIEYNDLVIYVGDDGKWHIRLYNKYDDNPSSPGNSYSYSYEYWVTQGTTDLSSLYNTLMGNRYFVEQGSNIHFPMQKTFNSIASESHTNKLPLTQLFNNLKSAGKTSKPSISSSSYWQW